MGVVLHHGLFAVMVIWAVGVRVIGPVGVGVPMFGMMLRHFDSPLAGVRRCA